MLKPRAAPTMALSQMGVLRTLALPYFSTNPSVILKAPPYSAISCPIKIKLACLSMLICRPSLMPSINRFSVAGGSLEMANLPVLCTGGITASLFAYTSFTSSCVFGIIAGESNPVFNSASMYSLNSC